MKNNDNFRKDLIIKYLVKLARIDSRDTFNKYYGEVESYIEGIVASPTSSEQLEDVRTIIAYKKNEMVLGV